jgi:hypothetical protein
MTVFSIQKLSYLCCLSLAVGWIKPSTAQSLSISRIYDQNNGQGVKVFVRTKILDQNNERVSLLQPDQITVKANGSMIENFEIEQPRDWQLDPSRIIILLDVSGSMNREDESGQTRGIAALKSIRTLLDSLNKYRAEVALVPFAETGKGCASGFFVPEKISTKVLGKFSPAKSKDLEDAITSLENKFNGPDSQRPCGSTNIGQPLREAVNYLRVNFPEPKTANEPRTRLGIILISDGYDPILSQANKYNEPKMVELENLLQENAGQIKLYTLGYGIKDGNTDADLIDTKVLERLAKAGQGTFEFSRNADEIIKSLEKFSQSLLGEYEIIYTPPNTEPDSKQEVEIQYNGAVDRKKFRLLNIATLPLPTRAAILVLTLFVFSMVGILPYLGWRWFLEKRATGK